MKTTTQRNLGGHQEMITPNEAAKQLGVSPQTIRMWIKSGVLPHIKMGSRYRIDESTISDIALNGTPTNALIRSDKK